MYYSALFFGEFMKMKLGIFLILTTIFANSFATRLVCYYGSWSVYRHGPGKFEVQDIDPFLCTHLIYAFVGLDYNGKVKILDPYNDIGDEWHEGAFSKIQNLKKTNPKLNLMLSIGGWNEGSEKYSRVVNDPDLRKVFVESILNITTDYNFDGFDLDWEYPNQRGGKLSDLQAFSALMKEISELFRPRGLILSSAVTSNAIISPSTYICEDLPKYLDFINVMNYDLHGGWERYTGHHTAMYPHPKDAPEDQHLNVQTGLGYWLNCTKSPEKLNIGLATYGRTFTLLNTSDHGVRAPASGPGPAGTYVGETGFLGYNEFCMEKKKGLWQIYTIQEQDVSYAVKGNVWIGYDDAKTIAEKVKYAKSLKIGGAMVWSVETDDFRGNCGEGKYPLLRAIISEWDLPLPQVSQPPETSLPVTTQKPAYSTDMPQTTLSPDHDEDYNSICRYVGHIFSHPQEGSSFFICVYNGTGTELKAVHIKCPDGLIFDDSIKVCNFPNKFEETDNML